MLKAITSFRGEAPRVTPRALPENAAQVALNASLLTGDLKAFRQFATTIGLANPAIVNTIFLLNGTWLSWDADVDVARGTISGDTTFRTYLTSPLFYGEPRFTDYSLATATGGPPYPVTTRPLGVPAPEDAPSLVLGVDTSPTTFSIDILDEGNVLATNWTTSPTVSLGGVRSEVTQSAVTGNPAPSYQLTYENNEFNAAWLYRNFGIGSAVAVEASADFRLEHGSGTKKQMLFHVLNTIDGNGLTVNYDESNLLTISVAAGWTSRSSSVLVSVACPALAYSTWYRVTVGVILNSDGTQTVTARLYSGTSLLATLTTTNLFNIGDYCGFVAETSDSDATDEFRTFYDNIHVTASGSTGFVPTTLATSYVYTYVNDLGEESAPSIPSNTIVRPDGISVTVTTDVAIPSGISTEYGISTKRIYRAATGNAGTVFRFVAEIPLATADYVDVLTDAQLGEVLISELWALPPDDLEGILALPNGVMAGFSKNQLCLSAQNYPHAWPVEYRLNTDTDIVGIGNIDTTVVIGTKSFVYVASGNDPAAYSMSKFEVPYAASSKKSFSYLTGIGVAFAGPDGLMAVAGPGQVRNLSDSVFTRDQWQALNPESMHAVAHNDIYWLFWESGSNRGCYAIDMKQTGFGVVQMAFHATCAYVDPVEDKMYLVLDSDEEPDDEALPVRADPPNYIDGFTIFEFEGGDTLMNYRYRGKLWMLQSPTWLSIAQVRGEDYDNLLFRIYGDGVQVDEVVIGSEEEFTTVRVDGYTTVEFELMGTSTVRIAQAAEDNEELG